MNSERTEITIAGSALARYVAIDANTFIHDLTFYNVQQSMHHQEVLNEIL